MGLHNKGNDGQSAIPIVWRFEHHTPGRVYLTLGSRWLSMVHENVILTAINVTKMHEAPPTK